MNDRSRDQRSTAAGQRQRGAAGQRPWGRAAAIIEPTGNAQKARFVPIGSVWETENGNLKLNIESTPQQWNDPHYRRVVLLSKSEEPDTNRQEGNARR